MPLPVVPLVVVRKQPWKRRCRLCRCLYWWRRAMEVGEVGEMGYVIKMMLVGYIDDVGIW